MADKIKLKDGTELLTTQIQTLSGISIALADTDALQDLKDSLTDDNLSEVEIVNNAGLTVGQYEHLRLVDAWKLVWLDTGLEVTISLREKTQTEIRLDALEQSNALLDGAITDIAEAVSTISEGGTE